MNSTEELKNLNNISIVNPLVLETLEKLIEKNKTTSAINFESDLDKLFTFIKSKSLKSNEKLIKKFLDYGRSIELILDSYFPIIAKRLGDQWVSDEITFSEVTIALGKIQFLNSKMEHQYLANLKVKSSNTKILMLIPTGEHHTYGGIAATRKLRGFGTKPFLTLDYKNEELEDLLYNEHYEFIGISSANNFMVDNINKLTIQIRNIIEKKVPVVLGGNLVNTYKKTNEKLKVDLVSQNIEQVLIELNLKYNKNSLKLYKVKIKCVELVANKLKHHGTNTTLVSTSEMYSRIISNIGDINLLIDLKGKILKINLPNKNINKNLNSWLNKNIFDFLTIESKEKLDLQITSLTEINILSTKGFELNHVSTDTGEFPVRYKGFKTEDKKNIILIGNDLSQIAEVQKRFVNSQLALEREYSKFRSFETKYKALIEFSEEALVILDASLGNILDLNNPAAKLLKQKKEN